jgi:hypothetical protein
MFSIAIFYSEDRLLQLRQTIECLEEMDGYGQCQKMLCADGVTNVCPTDFDILEVQRPGPYYCWATVWEAALSRARYENILYLDSDRILPGDYFRRALAELADDTFVFPARLYNLEADVPTDVLKRIRDNVGSYPHLLRADHRVWDDPASSVRRKNPMSGCVAFTKTTYRNSGGMDSAYTGWGYPDTDYFTKTFRAGCRFVPIDCDELHLKHGYRQGPRNSARLFCLTNLWNGVYYHRKWMLPLDEELHYLASVLGVTIQDAETMSAEQFCARYLKVRKRTGPRADEED